MVIGWCCRQFLEIQYIGMPSTILILPWAPAFLHVTVTTWKYIIENHKYQKMNSCPLKKRSLKLIFFCCLPFFYCSLHITVFVTCFMLFLFLLSIFCASALELSGPQIEIFCTYKPSCISDSFKWCMLKAEGSKTFLQVHTHQSYLSYWSVFMQITLSTNRNSEIWVHA